jgi:hypothetical protein
MTQFARPTPAAADVGSGEVTRPPPVALMPFDLHPISARRYRSIFNRVTFKQIF